MSYKNAYLIYGVYIQSETFISTTTANDMFDIVPLFRVSPFFFFVFFFFTKHHLPVYVWFFPHIFSVVFGLLIFVRACPQTKRYIKKMAILLCRCRVVCLIDSSSNQFHWIFDGTHSSTRIFSVSFQANSTLNDTQPHTSCSVHNYIL